MERSQLKQKILLVSPIMLLINFNAGLTNKGVGSLPKMDNITSLV
jgi:hypothetical protein